MSMPVNVRVEAVLEKRRALSDCCGAALDKAEGPEPDLPAWSCRACGNPCQRVLGPPETIEVTNG